MSLPDGVVRVSQIGPNTWEHDPYRDDYDEGVAFKLDSATLAAIAERLYEAWVADMATCLHSGYDHEPCPRCLAAALAEVFNKEQTDE